MKFAYRPRGVCSQMMEFEVEDDKIVSVTVTGGCDGNLKGISRLIRGMSVQEVVDRLAARMKGQNLFLNTHPGGVGFYNRRGYRRNKTAMLCPAHPDMPAEAARGFILPKGYRFADEMD